MRTPDCSDPKNAKATDPTDKTPHSPAATPRPSHLSSCRFTSF